MPLAISTIPNRLIAKVAMPKALKIIKIPIISGAKHDRILSM